MMRVTRDYKAAAFASLDLSGYPGNGRSLRQRDSTMTDPRLERIASLLTLKADGQYGLSAINQRQHALQAASLAERQGCAEPLIVASLLHDIGHLVHALGDNPAEAGIDDRHEERGHEFLRAWFGPEVTEPVR